MTLRRLLLGLGVALLSACALTPQASKQPTGAANLCDSSCQASLLLEHQGRGYCGAVAIAPHVVLTAAHCLVYEDIHMVTWDGRSVMGRAHRADEDLDLATIVTRERLDVMAPLGAPDFTPGFVVRPLRGWAKTLTLVGDYATDHHLFTPIRKGDSGSPVFDRRGRVVGVIVTCEKAFDEDDCNPHGGGRYAPANLGVLAVVTRDAT